MPVFIYKCVNDMCIDLDLNHEQLLPREVADDENLCLRCGKPMKRIIKGTTFRMMPFEPMKDTQR